MEHKFTSYWRRSNNLKDPRNKSVINYNFTKYKNGSTKIRRKAANCQKMPVHSSLLDEYENLNVQKKI